MAAMAAEHYFSSDYYSARKRFRAGAAALGYQCDSLAVSCGGQNGVLPTLDATLIAGADRERMLVLSSGLHGVEGFTGSAIQIALLECLLHSGPPPVSILLLHALNPYGFAHQRRTDSDNVDLNRNFLHRGETYTGAPEQFGEIESLLNLNGRPRHFDWLAPRLLWALHKYGAPAIKDAVASGQYVSPHGLFYGGAGRSATHRLLAHHLPRWTAGANQVMHVDVHSGLGSWGNYLIIADHDWGSAGLDWLSRRFGRGRVEPSEPDDAISYHKRGGMGLWGRALLAPRAYDLLTLEFGTYPGLLVLAAMRFENRQYHHGSRIGTTIGRALLREAFTPLSKRWRRSVVEQGLGLVHRAIDVCARDGLAPQTA